MENSEDTSTSVEHEQTNELDDTNTNSPPIFSAEESIKEMMSIEDLPRWNTTLEEIPEYTLNEQKEHEQGSPRIPYDDRVNSKIVLWQGDPVRLDVDVLANLTDEQGHDFSSGIAAHIFRAISRDNVELFLAECRSAGPCRTGDIITTNAFNLYAKKIIHTIGPRFNPKHGIAAENMLNTSYRRVLETFVDEGFSSLALPCLHLEQKNFSIETGSHVALRTIRRFIEKWGDKFDVIILVMLSEAEYNVYKENLPLYFPRSHQESLAVKEKLPDEIGNDIGALEVEGRGIKISASPGQGRGPSSNRRSTASAKPISTDSGFDSFRSVSRDIDDIRREQLENRSRQEEREEHIEFRYKKYLKVANNEDLSDVAIANIIYQCGVDKARRPIITFVPGNIPEDMDLTRVQLYMIKIMDKIVDRDYVAVYFHSDIGNSKPSNNWFKTVYKNLPKKYKKNIKQLYIVHPTFWLKMGLWFMRALVSEKFWDKLYFVDSLKDLYIYLDREQLRIPEDIISYEKRIGLTTTESL